MNELRALLQTDIVDSTRIVEQLGDGAAAMLWVSHDRMARDLLRPWRGREIDKSDGFLLLFVEVSDAVGYVLAYHTALAKLAVPLSARAGVHFGFVHLRENTPDDVMQGAKPIEVEGIAKPVTARVMAVARGGQTLISADAKIALKGSSLRLQSHGHWRMKGIAAPVELFEVGEHTAPFQPPPDSAKAYRVVRQSADLWLPVRDVRHSLPAERDEFVGRQAELQEMALRFENGARLVSVLGPGGTGKTRFAQRFGWTWLGDYPGGVWFCDLSQASSADGILHSVGQGLDVPLSGADPIIQLAHAIAGRGSCLVILDNFEQVARFANETLGNWLDRTRDATFIATSRQILGITGEVSMPLPTLNKEEGAALFRRRAHAVRPDFSATPGGDKAIAPLVELLDGLPLAIELAAARVRVMTPDMLLSGMGHRFKLLVASGGRRDRHLTLRATIDWSWHLLSEAERIALAQLSVFEGGFSLASAQAVLDMSSLPDLPWTGDVIQGLVEKSLVRQLDQPRFDLLISVRDYANEKLQAGELLPQGRRDSTPSTIERHWRFFAAITERQAIADGCADIENIVAACRRATAACDVEAAIGALLSSWTVLKLRGPFGVVIGLAEALQFVVASNSAGRAAIEWVHGSSLAMLSDPTKADSRFKAGLHAARVSGERAMEAQLLCSMAELQIKVGHAQEAVALLLEARATADSVGSIRLQIEIGNAMGQALYALEQLDEAELAFNSSLQLAVVSGDERWQAGLLGNLGCLHFERGRFDEAETNFNRALVFTTDSGNRKWEGNTRCNYGLVLVEKNQRSEARIQFKLALQISRELGHVQLESVLLGNLGIVDDLDDSYFNACRLFEQGIEKAISVGAIRYEIQFRGYLGLIYQRLGRHDESSACLDIADSLCTHPIDTTSLIILTCCKIRAAALAGRMVHARTMMRRIEEMLTDRLAGRSPELARAINSARRALGTLCITHPDRPFTPAP